MRLDTGRERWIKACMWSLSGDYVARRKLAERYWQRWQQGYKLYKERLRCQLRTR